MADAILPARGFRDVLPSDKAKREAVIASIRRSYARFGFTEIETPAMEPLERLLSNQGGENEKLVFKVLRRGLDASEPIAPAEACDLGLRYDLTVPLVRYYASHSHELPRVLRTLQIGPVWRAERPQKGRYRQFLQCDIDILGEHSNIAEVELINATLFALTELGITGVTVRLNHRRLLDSLLSAFGVPAELKAKSLIIIDKLDKIGVGGVCDQLADTALAEGPVAAIRSFLTGFEDVDETDIERVVELLPNDVDESALNDIRAITEAVLASGAGVRVAFDPTLVRGMGYYTGPIFEVAHPSSSSSICGGGRYDSMGAQLFGRDVPASGFSIGFERIVGLVDTERFSGREPVLALVYDKDASASVLSALQTRYIREGRSVLLAKRAKNLNRQLNDLVKQGVARFAFVDADTAVDDTLEERALEA
jgi:histidyl-tRNA synthetase